ncbi:hypothetical protein [Staphylococcus pasteuri]|uniref:hypothetical protein n=1 Tax=Staphylococcus pasteuri TaxID=45972 RepID=UPI000E3742DB|nr:hypothetical protein [Staphylococcus pasteuri]RFD69582.1 hypothetical protein A7974_03700 [Staphylococcus pasteuri]
MNLDKPLTIAIIAWFVFSLAFTFIGVEFIRALGVAAVISIVTYVFFEYVYYDNEKKTEC